METGQFTQEQLQQMLTRFLTKYEKRGFACVSRNMTTAELNKPAGFPRWLFKEESRLVVIDKSGTIYVSKVHY